MQVVDRRRAAGRATTRAPSPPRAPTSSAPIRPGPRVTATARRRRASRPPRRAPRARPARPARGGGARRPRARRRRSARAARPGTRRRSRAISPSARDERRGGLVARGLDPEDHAPPARRDRVLPHDQRVLAVVRVVAAPDPARLEAERSRTAGSRRVRDAHLERVAAVAVAGGQLEQVLEQRASRSRGRRWSGVDGDVHHVPGVDVAGDDHVADERASSSSKAPTQIERRLRELAGEHRARPRRRVRARARSARSRSRSASAEVAELDACADGAHRDAPCSASGTRR